MKYSKILKNNILQTFEYRSAMVVDTSIGLLSTLTYIFIWYGLYKSGADISSDYSLNETIFYYCLIPIIGLITLVHLDRQGDQIRSGEFSSTLLKPYSFVNASFFQSIGIKVSSLILLMPVYLTLLLVLSRLFEFEINGDFFLIAFLAAIFAYMLNFFVDISINFMAFWLEDSWVFRHIKNFLFGAFGGVAFPVAFAPDWLRTIIEALPFKFMYYVPISYLQGKREFSEYWVSDLVSVLIWSAVFFLIASFVWKKGVKKYSAYGG